MSHSRGLLLLVMLAGGAGLVPQSAGSVTKEIRIDQEQAIAELVEAKSWQSVIDELEPYFKRGEETVWAHAFYGRALLRLDRIDEGAFHLDRAIEMKTADGERSSKALRTLRKELKQADPLTNRRSGFFKKLKRYYEECTERLLKDGHDGQALDLLNRIEWLLTTDDDAELRRTLQRLRTANKDVDLNAAGDKGKPSDKRPLIEFESERYKLACNLEKEVIQAVGETMDDIFESYVDIYLGGDEDSLSMKKAEIRIHGSWDKMIEDYRSPNPSPGLGGWWSPGENKVTCFDTRGQSGSLDEMLGTLFHEASHQFMSTLSSRGGRSPAWLNEGTASFFEGARALQDRRVIWPDAAINRLRSLMASLSSGRGPSVADVIGFNQPGSYPGEYYSFGWGLVYYFQEYEDPQTLAYVWRPYYLDYMNRVTTKGGDSRDLFEEVFLAKGNPGGFTDFKGFVDAWTTWIQEDVWPMHSGNQPRALRLARVERYLEAADLTQSDRKSAVTEADLLQRALRDIEYVRTEIDGEGSPNGDVALEEAGILRRLEREGAEAWMIQLVLDLSDAGTWTGLNDDVYITLTERLGKINKSYRSLSLIRNRTRSLRRDADRLLKDYLARGDFNLRAYTFAAKAGRALHDAELRAEANRLRGQASQSGTLAGTVRPLVGQVWSSIFDAKPDEFSHSRDAISLSKEFGPSGQICENIKVSGEYELRGVLGREGDISRGTLHGVVVAGTKDGDWTVVGIDHRGLLSVLNYTAEAGGVTSTKIELDEQLEAPLENGDSPRFIIRVLPDGNLIITFGDLAPVELELPYEMPKLSHPGIFAKGGRTKLSNFVIEDYP